MSVSRSGEGLDGSSEESDGSGSEDSQQHDEIGDPSAGREDNGDAAAGLSQRKKKKKWDRHSSLVALSKAVDHVCSSDTRDEAVLASLQKILRDAMAKSGKHTQNTLRDLMRKLQEKQDANEEARGGVDDLGARMSSLSVDQRGHPVLSSASSSSGPALTSASSPVNGSFPSLSPSSAAAAAAGSSSSAASAASPSSGFRHQCGLCHSARDKAVVLADCGHEFDRSCMSEFLMSRVGAKKAVGITCPYTSSGGSSSSSSSSDPCCGTELSPGVIQSVLSASDFESYLNATLMSIIESDDCLTVVCPNKKCSSLMSVEALQNRDVPSVITEKDEEGRVLTKETFLHFKEFRVRSVLLSMGNGFAEKKHTTHANATQHDPPFQLLLICFCSFSLALSLFLALAFALCAFSFFLSPDVASATLLSVRSV